MEIIQILIVLFVVFAISRIFINIKNRNISILESLFWTILWLFVAIFTIFSEYLSIISSLFGIDRGVDIVVYIGLIILAYLIFRLYMKLENTNKKVTKVIRTIAIKKSKK